MGELCGMWIISLYICYILKNLVFSFRWEVEPSLLSVQAWELQMLSLTVPTHQSSPTLTDLKKYKSCVEI